MKHKFPPSLIKLFQFIASNGREILIEQISYGLAIINSSGTFDCKRDLFALYPVTGYFLDVSEDISFLKIVCKALLL